MTTNQFTRPDFDPATVLPDSDIKQLADPTKPIPQRYITLTIQHHLTLHNIPHEGPHTHIISNIYIPSLKTQKGIINMKQTDQDIITISEVIQQVAPSTKHRCICYKYQTIKTLNLNDPTWPEQLLEAAQYLKHKLPPDVQPPQF